jgi:hypothetical protein
MIRERPDLRSLLCVRKRGTWGVRGSRTTTVPILIPDIHILHCVVPKRERHHQKLDDLVSNTGAGTFSPHLHIPFSLLPDDDFPTNIHHVCLLLQDPTVIAFLPQPGALVLEVESVSSVAGQVCVVILNHIIFVLVIFPSLSERNNAGRKRQQRNQE